LLRWLLATSFDAPKAVTFITTSTPLLAPSVAEVRHKADFRAFVTVRAVELGVHRVALSA
jgi:hypothetical protein